MAQVDPSIERDAAPEPNRNRLIDTAHRWRQRVKDDWDNLRRNGVIYTAGRWWELVKDYWDILRPMRFCVLVWIAITILIVFIPQSQDALLALFEDALTGPGMFNLLAFALLAFLWAGETFYWSRFVLASARGSAARFSISRPV